jgi:hypothetical protein
MRLTFLGIAVIATLGYLSFAAPCRADEKAKVQKQLNSEVLNQGFDVKREDELNAYIDEATRKGLKPKTYTGNHWRRGATCGDLLSYSWTEYRDCMYYYRYYGRYYPYP